MSVDLTGPAQNSPSKLRSSPALNVSSVRCVKKGPSEDGRHRTRRGEAVGQARKAMGSHFNRTDGSTCPLFCRQGRSPASLQLPCRFEKEKKARPTIPAQVSKYLPGLALLHARTHTHTLRHYGPNSYVRTLNAAVCNGMVCGHQFPQLPHGLLVRPGQCDPVAI